MNRTILYIIVFFGSSSFSFSQIRIVGQLEAGINGSGSRYISKNYMPLVSPVLGYWTKAMFGKRFSINLGVQYLKVGNKSYYHSDRVNQYHDYSTDAWQSISFQKISMPLTIGYDFQIKRTTSTVYLGIKRNYLLNGKIEERYKFTDRKDPEKNSDNTYYDNPFAEGYYINPASRWNRGVVLGYTLSLGKKTHLNLNYSMFQFTHYSRGCFGYSYNNNDLSFSLKYCVFSERKKQ